MRGCKWRTSLQVLVNSYGVDTELDAPDHVIAYHIDSFLNSIRKFSCHEGYTPQNNVVCTILQQPTAKVRKPKRPAHI